MKRIAYLAGLYTERHRRMRMMDDMCHGKLSPGLRKAFDIAIDIYAEDLQHLEKELIEEAKAHEGQDTPGSPGLPEGSTK